MKKVLFSLLFLIGFVGFVSARDITDLKEQWSSYSGNLNEVFAFDNKYVYVTYENIITKINKRTGEEESIELEYRIDELLNYKDSIYVLLDYGKWIYKLDVELNLVNKIEIPNNFEIDELFIKDNVLYAKDYRDFNMYIINDDLKFSSILKNSDGSFFIIHDDNKFSLLDKDLNIVRTVQAEEGYSYFSAVMINNKVYVLSSTDSSKGWWNYDDTDANIISVYDREFNLIYEKEYEARVACFQDLLVVDNVLYAQTPTNKYYVLNLEDLNETLVDSSDVSIGKYVSNMDYDIVHYNSDDVYTLQEEEELAQRFFSTINSTILNFKRNTDGTYLITTYDYFNGVDNLFIFNIDGKLLFHKEIDTALFSNFNFFDKYIIFYDCSDDQKIHFMNYSGEIEFSINTEDNSDLYRIFLIPQKDGVFLVRTSAGRLRAAAAADYFELVYYGFDPVVETNTFGKGTVNLVNDNYNVGDVVSFKYAPDTGYVIDKVIVKDEQGNNIEVKDDTFVMPNSNVVIEVYFAESVVNPNTGVFMSIGASLLFIIAAVVIVVLNRTKVQKYE